MPSELVPGPLMTGRTVVATLAGEAVGRYRVFDFGADARGRPRPVQDAHFIAEAQRRFLLQGASREDLERAEFTVLDE